MNTEILKAEGVRKSYGKKEVLSGLDLEIRPGKIYGLIGRNGAGKTTLLGILTAQNTLDGGSVTYGGEPVWENQAALENICFSRELRPTLMSGQNGLKIRHYLKTAAIFYPSWDEEYAQRLLAEFQLEPKKKIFQLSKGQMSMVTILIALASRAPITILDEPAAGLDVVARERFYQLLLEDYARNPDRTFIVSTHIIEEAAGVFERVIILDQGRILEDAPTEELIDQFRYVSGREDQVDEACRGVQVLSVHRMGRHKTCAVRGNVKGLEQTGLDVDVAPMTLQNVFVALCGHEKEGAE